MHSPKFGNEIDFKLNAEADAKEARRQLQAVLDNATVAIFLMDERQQCTYMNAAAERLTGYSLAETWGRALHDVVHHTHPDGRHYPIEDCPIDRAFPERNRMQGEEVFVHKDGSFYPVAFTASPIRDDAGDPVGTIIEVRGIADEKARDTALRESEERFRNMAENAPVMMWMTDTKGNCTYFNQSWLEFTGQTRGEAESSGRLGALHPDDQMRVSDAFEVANVERESFRLEYRLRDCKGQYRWVIDTASPRFGPDGKFLGHIGSVLDIHERRRNESLRGLQTQLLELAIQDKPLPQILKRLLLAVEDHADQEIMASVLLLDSDRKRLRHGAAPRLPEAYIKAIDGVEIGPDVGSCGSAAYRREPVFVSDIQNDPLWADFRELAGENGLKACWSTPIVDADDDLLGTFAMYHREERSASAEELQLVNLVTHTAALVIGRRKVQDALRDETRLLETLNKTGADLAGELDLQRVVQSVTDAGVELTGAQFGAFF